MHIKYVVVEGFRVYRERTELSPFSPKHNVIVGANGSGKSNFFAAVEFVLGNLSGGPMTADMRKGMLHEGGGAHVMSAYVEIYFDNSNGRFPTEKDELVLKRAIGLKKDEYFVDRKHVTKTEVASLLESAGFSRSNPYNIVPQGKVALLTTMTPEKRLDLLKDIAGTKIYDERREESLGIMKETAARRVKTDTMLTDIEKRLKELDEEKEELAKYQALDKRRKIAEYTYYEKERLKAKAELDKMERKRNEDSERTDAQQKREDELKAGVKDADKKLKSVGSELALLQTECRTSADEQKKLLESVARGEMAVQQSRDDRKSRAAAALATKGELKALDGQVAEAQAEVQRRAPDCEAKVAEAARLASTLERSDAEMQQLDSKQAHATQFKSRQDRDRHLNKEAAELRTKIKKKEQQAATLQKDLEQAQARQENSVLSASEGRKRLEAERAKAEQARTMCTSLRQERDAATDRRKELWRKEQQLGDARKSTTSELDKAQRTLQHTMSRSQWEAIVAVKRIAHEQGIQGCHGMLIELMQIDSKFHTAVEVAAGNQLFQVVVDNDNVAAKLLTELQRANAGRVTFMPLNRLRPGADPDYPQTEDAIPMLQRLKFDEKYRPAFKQVFRKSLIVRDLAVGSRFSKSHDLDCVTIDGDQVNRKGALTGGYLDARRSRLQAQADIMRLTTQRSAYEVQVGAEQKQLQEVDGQVTSLLGKLKQTEAQRQRAEAAAEQEALDLPATDGRGASPDADAQKEEALKALQAAAQAERQRLDAVTEEAASEFTDGLSTAESKRRGELQASLAKLQKELVAAERQKNKAEQKQAQLETELREHLLKRQEELRAALATDEQEDTRAESEGADEQLTVAQQKLASVESALSDTQQRREQKALQERALQKQVEELKAQLATERTQQQDEAKELDRLLTRKTLLLGKIDEFNDGIRRLGSLPKDAFDADRTQSSKQLMATIAKCQQELQALTHVNKKALDQFANFSDQRDKLIERQAELDEAKTSIDELIQHLDNKKDEAIERTFKLASRHFTETFKELVPGGSGKLVMQTNVLSETAAAGATAATRVAQYSGVKVQVSFTGGGQSLMELHGRELSGGQKTMAALCLIFAIQRCDPAPFYIFDEVDANLDAAHRASFANMIERQSSEVDENGDERPPTQFITTTFRPELIHAGDQFYGVTHRSKASTIKTITKEEALRIISETSSRSKQHVGGTNN